MKTLFTTTTVLGVGAGTVALLYDRKNKELNTSNAKGLTLVSTAVTGTLAGEAIVKEHDLDEMNRKYNATTAAAYVGSMSDEQLKEAMISVGILPGEDDENTTVKTI